MKKRSNNRNRRTKGSGAIYIEDGRYVLRHPAIGKRTLGTADRAEAERVAQERYGDLIAAWQRSEGFTAIVSRADEAQAALAAIQAARNATKTPLADCWRRYMDALAVTGDSTHTDATTETPLSPRTIDGYEQQWAMFAAGMTGAGVAYVEDIHRDAVIQYFKGIRTTRSASTYNRHLTGVAVVLRGAIGPNGHLDCLARAKTRVEQQMRPLTQDEIRLVRKQAQGWLLPAIDVGLATGLRLGDVVTLRWADVDLVGGFVFCAARKTGKSQAYYCPDAMQSLRDWRDLGPVGEHVFPVQAARYLGGERPGDATHVSRECSAFLRAALAGAPELDRIGFASLRKTAATLRAAKTGDRQAAAALLGHGSVAVTNQHYILPDREQQMQLAMAAANPLANFTDAELLAELSRRGWKQG